MNVRIWLEGIFLLVKSDISYDCGFVSTVAISMETMKLNVKEYHCDMTSISLQSASS